MDEKEMVVNKGQDIERSGWRWGRGKGDMRVIDIACKVSYRSFGLVDQA